MRRAPSHPPVSEKAPIRSASVPPEFRVDDDLDLGWLDAPPALVDQRNSKSLTIRRRTQRERRSAVSDPFIAPFGHREEWQAERRAHLCQRILNAGAVTPLTIFAPHHDSALDEAC